MHGTSSSGVSDGGGEGKVAGTAVGPGGVMGAGAGDRGGDGGFWVGGAMAAGTGVGGETGGEGGGGGGICSEGFPPKFLLQKIGRRPSSTHTPSSHGAPTVGSPILQKLTPELKKHLLLMVHGLLFSQGTSTS